MARVRVMAWNKILCFNRTRVRDWKITGGNKHFPLPCLTFYRVATQNLKCYFVLCRFILGNYGMLRDILSNTWFLILLPVKCITGISDRG